MRTTLTLADDVAVRLKRLSGFSSFKEAVNAALRAGLDQLETPIAKPRDPYRIQPVKLGAKVMNIDDVAEILDIIEGD
ncbi:MAG: hypothetical protein WBD47_02270 [Phormidesmis sp.]